MKVVVIFAALGLLVVNFAVAATGGSDSPVCTDVSELMFTDKPKCEKGDIIMVNPMMAAFLCDLAMPSIPGERIVICHYLGKKRAERKSVK